MTSSTRTRIILAIAAAVWFVVALTSGEDGAAQIPLRTFSIAGSIVTGLFLLYEKRLWKVKPVRFFTKKPLLEGTWRGELQSDFIRPGESQPIPVIPTVIRIKQTDSTLLVTQFTAESTSVTEQGELTRTEDGRWRLSWLYSNEPRPTLKNRSDAHRGAADLWISGTHGDVLEGGYFTNRNTRGDLRFDQWSAVTFGSAKEALDSDSFSAAHPFSRDEHL